ncbi:MCE family protein [Mycobacterium sp. URHB0044]|uniref:MCE family protein n=1 Tax=Mycobacterium sp. URHB0044 TaxID=1380386 RepID=UPI000490203C|nr:MCE family protein [Mycobacterium sp. URHB0044]
MSSPGTTRPPSRRYTAYGAVTMVLVVGCLVLLGLQFRGDLTPSARLTLISARGGLSLVAGSQVTLNGVHVGRVVKVEAIDVSGKPRAKLTLDVEPRYLSLMPANVNVDIAASTLFGNKFVTFSIPKDPVPERLEPSDVIDVSSVTTEFNSLFDTMVSIAEKVDPVKLNQTLTSVSEALDGFGDRFGRSIVNGNDILADVNPQMPQIRSDIQRLADLSEVYTRAAPDLFDGLDDAATTAGTLTDQERNLDAALVATLGFSNTSKEPIARAGLYIARGASDFLPTSQLLDEYSPEIFCTIRNYHDVEPKSAAAGGGNGYSGIAHTELVGAGNPYVYPDNLPRVNARGGPEGRPGCWQPVTRDLWPMPYLVVDTGASIAPYNHLGLGQPSMTEYVWGRQVGERTINP